VGKVYKVEKVRSTFHTFHDYLNFYGEKKDDGLLTIYVSYSGQAVSNFLEPWFLHIEKCKTAKNTKFADLKNIEVEQRIIWYIIFRIKKTSPEKTLLLPFRRKIKIKGKTQEDIIFRSYWRMGIFIA